MDKKKPIWIMMIIVLLCSLVVACANKEATSNSNGLSEELNVFNWSEYLPEGVITKFEKEYNVKVNYSTYSSNEEMLAKLMTGSNQYDIAVSTGYMVDVMRKHDLLEPLDKNNIPNFKNIAPEFLKQDYDPDNTFSVPYMAGGLVLAVDTSKVTTPVESYADLWREEFENSVVVPDEQRAILGIANKVQGKSMNETDEAVLTKSKELLIKLSPNIKAYDSDSPKTLLINGEVKVAAVYNSEALLAMEAKPSIKAVFPKEGMMLFLDSFIIPKNAPHKKQRKFLLTFCCDLKLVRKFQNHFHIRIPTRKLDH